ncbi:MAG: hypothetical protein MUC28_03545 [Planctomycetes bacterium]|nr:hypothetical protein [Planctomycetota bacterium]
MKQSNILMTVVAAMVALVAVTGVALYSYAQDNTGETANAPCALGERGNWQNLTDAQKAELEAKRAEREAAMEAKRQKVEDAMYQGYDAWTALIEQEQGADAPILDQVNQGNFDRFVEAHEYLEKAQTIFTELGIERGGMGMGFGGRYGKMGPGGTGGRLGGMMGLGGLNSADMTGTSGTQSQ